MNHVQGRGYVDPGVSLDFSFITKLGWTKFVSLDEGIKRTIQWYKDNAVSWGEICRGY